MADCGGSAFTNQTNNVNFVTSCGKGNGINSKGGGTLTCITPGTTTYEKIQRDVYVFGSGNQRDPGNYVNVTYNIAKTQGGGNWSYALSPFNINVEAKMDLYYETVNGETHLIAKLYDILSYLIGPTQCVGSSQFFAGLYPAGDLAYGLAVTTSPGTPATDNPSWRTCLGGWYTAPWSSPCAAGTCPEGSSSIPPVGGTYYLWGSKAVGTKFDRTNYSRTPARMDGPIYWDLGVVSDFQNTHVYVFARMMESNYHGSGCNTMHFRAAASHAAIAFDIPPISVCPPVLMSIVQDREICENCAVTTFEFEANDLLGAPNGQLQIEYIYGATPGANVNWADAQMAVFNVEKDKPVFAKLDCLKPASKYCWRARYIVTLGSYTGHSEYEYGCFETLYIPDSTWAVPDITKAECETLARGGYIEQFEEKP